MKSTKPLTVRYWEPVILYDVVVALIPIPSTWLLETHGIFSTDSYGFNS